MIAYVPMRSGSTRLKDKNIKNFCGMPLCFWTLFELQKADSIDRIVVSTDSEVYRDIVLSFNFSKLTVDIRPSEYSTATCATERTYFNWSDRCKIKDSEDIFLCQVTTPFLTWQDVQGAVDFFENRRYDSILSVVRSSSFLWQQNLKQDFEAINYVPKERPRTQDMRQFQENGLFYIFNLGDSQKNNCRIFGDIGCYVMPEYAHAEIDTEDDFLICENIFRIKNKRAMSHFFFDFDGVWTHNYRGCSKIYNMSDSSALNFLRDGGIKLGCVSQERHNTKEIFDRSEILQLDFCAVGINDKRKYIIDFCTKEKLSLFEIGYMGNDIPDLGILNIVGYPGVPADVEKILLSILRKDVFIADRNGGDGAIRDFVNWYCYA
jgi:N-acylneuraminate cytidylyltransferase